MQVIRIGMSYYIGQSVYVFEKLERLFYNKEKLNY